MSVCYRSIPAASRRTDRFYTPGYVAPSTQAKTAELQTHSAQLYRMVAAAALVGDPFPSNRQIADELLLSNETGAIESLFLRAAAEGKFALFRNRRSRVGLLPDGRHTRLPTSRVELAEWWQFHKEHSK